MVEIKLKYGMAVAETVGADIGQRFLCLLAMSAELVGSGAVVARNSDSQSRSLRDDLQIIVNTNWRGLPWNEWVDVRSGGGRSDAPSTVSNILTLCAIIDGSAAHAFTASTASMLRG